MRNELPVESLILRQEECIPNILVNCVIIGFDNGCLKVLLSRLKDDTRWLVPGCFVEQVEDLDDAAIRLLESKTGQGNVYLKQYCFFGKKEQSIADKDKEILRLFNQSQQEADYTHSRLVHLGYYSLIKFEDVNISAHEFEEVKWFDISDIPLLYPHQDEILQTAIITIRKQVGFIPIGYELLPVEFTMPELRGIYEAILGRELDRRNFQRKMLSIGFIKPMNETRKVGAHKSPNLYSFVKDKYDEAEKYGIQIMSNNL